MCVRMRVHAGGHGQSLHSYLFECSHKAARVQPKGCHTNQRLLLGGVKAKYSKVKGDENDVLSNDVISEDTYDISNERTICTNL